MLQPHPVAFLFAVAVVLCGFFAVFLLRTGGSAARRLALLLVVEGVVLGTTGAFDFFLTPAVRAAPGYATWVQFYNFAHFVGDAFMLALYPPFLAAALGTPLTRPFGRPAARRALLGAGAVLLALILFSPMTVGVVILYATMASLFGFALVASLQAWRAAPPGLGRTRAGMLALAFGVRDVCWSVSYVYGIRMVFAGVGADPLQWPAEWYFVYASGTVFAVPAIAYGILRAQLFDIDLRLRWTLKQSTLAAAFVALFYLVTEGAERLLSAELGNLAGLLTAALLVFFLSPLQRFAERVASAAMPNTKDTPEYVAFRKLQVYQGALMDATRDGRITETERALLNRLRDSLGIAPGDAEAVERDLAASAA